ncbi:cell wall-binding repeat-containing protein [Candidatus Poriferisodalis sp.]|uniref:cell wall-binding repeat-containing protein n=1 Tax=Candidatus Poriferisodalis sp. TaxID=3101277 RepID=UPI003B5182BA
MALLIAASVLAPGSGTAGAAAVEINAERLFGLTRYETAVAVAEAYLEERRGSRTPVATALLTSGLDEHYGYAVVTPALSRQHIAPLLLTMPDELPVSVAEFLGTNGIRTVYILGGTDVVSSEVEDAVDEISNVGVVRIARDDVYATAVAVADRVGPRTGQPGEYRSHGGTAVVATDTVFADALAVGPLAYRGEHPVLLTPRDSLHPGVADFLERNVDHVVILGGQAAVSNAVEDSIEELGITVDRLFGPDRFATAVEIAEELLGDEQPEGCFDGGELGLAYGRKAADALVSGPLLGELCAPLLLAELASLPAAVRRFLESDQYETGDADGDLMFTVFGGPAALSSNVVAQAEAAATLDPIRARVSGVQGRCFFTVTFVEPVLTTDATNVRYYRLGGSTLDPRDAEAAGGDGTSTTRVTVVLTGASQSTDAAVPTGCDEETALRAREEIEIVGGVIGTNGDQRTVRRTSTTVSVDRSRPRLTVTALDTADVVWVESNEPLRLGSGAVEFRRGGANPQTATEYVQITRGAVRFEVPVPPSFADSLQNGDRVTVKEGAVRDLVGLDNREVSIIARRDTTSPRVSKVIVTEPEGRWASSIDIDGRERGVRERSAFTIRAKRDGDAYGAVGNDWRLRIDVELAWSANQASEINVVPAGKRIELRVSHSRSLGDLADELNGHHEFSTLFEAEVDSDVDGDRAVLDDDVEPVHLEGGLSTVDFTLEWTEPVVNCEAGEIEIDVDGDGDYDFFLDGYNAESWGVEFVDAPEGNPAIIAGGADCDFAPGVQEGTMVARLQSDDISALPSTRSRLRTLIGAAIDRVDNESVNRRFSSFSRP